MSNTPFMPLWVSDFLGDTLDLDAKEIGAYMLLLMAMWQRDGTLPDDPKKLQRVARVGRDWPRVWDSISGYFTVEDGVISNKRLTLELHKVNTKRRVNSQAGARGGRAKALKEKKARLANATVSPQQPYPEPEREKRETNVSPKKTKPPDRFDEFWNIVPRKVGRGAAEKAYAAALKITDHDTIFSAMKRYAQERDGKEIKYTAHLATWLNQKRWTDESPPPDFHDQLEMKMGNANGLPVENGADHSKIERLPPAQLRGPGDFPRIEVDPDQKHGRGDQQAYRSVLNPRKFGGAR